jgi:Icc-related predicted phosphoesterase
MSIERPEFPGVRPTRTRVAAVADLHFGRHPPEFYRPLFAAANEADVLAICGDLTDHGRLEQAQGLARLITQQARVPVVSVLGNHDFENGQADAVRETLAEVGVKVLVGERVSIAGVGFAGVKGFCGGFGPRALGPWGEPIIKAFVQETLAEALKLETALSRLRATPRIALLHYSPVASTVVGEPEEIYPFLGSSRLEEPLIRLGVAAVFHGHAHHGRFSGQTAQGAPVFNVSLPLLQSLDRGRFVHILDVDSAGADARRAEG